MSLEGNAITEYASLSGKIHTLVIDKTLSISGAAADAKKVGQEIERLDAIVPDAKEAYEEAKASYDETVATMREVAQEVAEEVAKEEVKETIDALEPQDIGCLMPQIIATATPGSTVTCAKGETVLTAEEVDGVWTFDIPEYGEWAVNTTSVDESGETSETYTSVFDVDTVKLYYAVHIQRQYYTPVYFFGEENTELLGGLTLSVSQGSPTMTQNADHLLLTGPANSNCTIISAKDIAKGDHVQFFAIATRNDGNNQTTASVGFNSGGNSFNLTTNSTKVKINKTLTSNENLGKFYVSANVSSSATYVYLYAMVLVKEDEWEELLTIAGVDSVDVSTLVNDREKMAEILSNLPAVHHMVSCCTGLFMVKAVQSTVFLNALATSQYKEIVYANEHWAKFLAAVV